MQPWEGGGWQAQFGLQFFVVVILIFFCYFGALSLVSLIFLVLSMVFWLFADVCLVW